VCGDSDDNCAGDGGEGYLRCGESKYDVFLVDFLPTPLLLHATPHSTLITFILHCPTLLPHTDTQRGNICLCVDEPVSVTDLLSFLLVITANSRALTWREMFGRISQLHNSRELPCMPQSVNLSVSLVETMSYHRHKDKSRLKNPLSHTLASLRLKHSTLFGCQTNSKTEFLTLGIIDLDQFLIAAGVNLSIL